jgi:hypothetical protein
MRTAMAHGPTGQRTRTKNQRSVEQEKTSGDKATTSSGGHQTRYTTTRVHSVNGAWWNQTKKHDL